MADKHISISVSTVSTSNPRTRRGSSCLSSSPTTANRGEGEGEGVTTTCDHLAIHIPIPIPKTKRKKMTVTTDFPSLNTGIAHAGYLMKRNPTGTWQKRYCVVTNVKFIYYKHKSRVEKGDPQGIVSLIGSSCLLPEPGDINCLKKENCFVLKSSNKEYYLCGESKKDFNEWMKATNESIATLQKIRHCELTVIQGNTASPHSFKKVHFSKATNCVKCNTPIHGLGKQGYMCQVCLICVHKKCAFKIEDDCGHTKVTSDKTAVIKPAAPKRGLMERFRFTISQTSSTQYAQLDTAQLQIALIHAEESELTEIDAINKKYDEQVKEIMDELIKRYLVEAAPIEKKYNTQKQDLLKEIQLREMRQKQS